MGDRCILQSKLESSPSGGRDVYIEGDWLSKGHPDRYTWKVEHGRQVTFAVNAV